MGLGFVGRPVIPFTKTGCWIAFELGGLRTLVAIEEELLGTYLPWLLTLIELLESFEVWLLSPNTPLSDSVFCFVKPTLLKLITGALLLLTRFPISLKIFPLVHVCWFDEPS
jgi:hypothetical protein